MSLGIQCDPNLISRASSCLRCLTDGQLMIVRTFLLCKWAQKAGGSAGLATPFAFFNQAELDWSVSGTQPTEAVIEFSSNNTSFAPYAPYVPYAPWPWASTADVFDNGYYRVIGKTAGIAVTNYSNIVSIGV